MHFGILTLIMGMNMENEIDIAKELKERILEASLMEDEGQAKFAVDRFILNPPSGDLNLLLSLMQHTLPDPGLFPWFIAASALCEKV